MDIIITSNKRPPPKRIMGMNELAIEVAASAEEVKPVALDIWPVAGL